MRSGFFDFYKNPVKIKVSLRFKIKLCLELVNTTY